MGERRAQLTRGSRHHQITNKTSSATAERARASQQMRRPKDQPKSHVYVYAQRTLQHTRAVPTCTAAARARQREAAVDRETWQYTAMHNHSLTHARLEMDRSGFGTMPLMQHGRTFVRTWTAASVSWKLHSTQRRRWPLGVRRLVYRRPPVRRAWRNALHETRVDKNIAVSERRST